MFQILPLLDGVQQVVSGVSPGTSALIGSALLQTGPIPNGLQQSSPTGPSSHWGWRWSPRGRGRRRGCWGRGWRWCIRDTYWRWWGARRTFEWWGGRELSLPLRGRGSPHTGLHGPRWWGSLLSSRRWGWAPRGHRWGPKGWPVLLAWWGRWRLSWKKKIILIVITFDFFLFLEYENTFLAQ